MKAKSIVLVVMIIFIIGTIWYFESTKSHPTNPSETINADINIEDLQNKSATEQVKHTLTEADKERIAQKAQQYERAKELVNPDGYINVENITIGELIGAKVIMIDFWTYSCINCQRTLPYLTTWYDKYEKDGLVIIGVHTPEFAFEEKYENVLGAVEKWNITYPVVQDNDRETWSAYQNRYWPRKYIIDIDGFIVYDHIGEGAYDETEKKIQELLEERNVVLGVNREVNNDIVYFDPQKGDSTGVTPEIYFGYKFNRDHFGNTESWRPLVYVNYSIPENTQKDFFYVNGTWVNYQDDMEVVSDEAYVQLEFHARDVNVVAGSEEPALLEVFIDGERVDEIDVSTSDLYSLYKGDRTSTRTLLLRAEKGIKFNTFTFG